MESLDIFFYDRFAVSLHNKHCQDLPQLGQGNKIKYGF